MPPARANSRRSSPVLHEQVFPIFDRLRERVDRLSFSAPVAHVYNPLGYAGENFRSYLERFALPCQPGRDRALFLGMNPGPWGMAQTGVPFGTVTNVREWLQLASADISRPANEHPKRPVLGFDCPRDEVSGQRFWGWAEHHFRTPERFFQRFFVLNYCPLLFLEESGRNLTPDKLRAAEREPLIAACDQAVADFVRILRPSHLLGIGVFAERCAERILSGASLDFQPKVGRVLHPSPASPAANRGWAEAVNRQLAEQGFEVPPAGS